MSLTSLRIKEAAFRLAAVLASTLISLLAVEVGYRFYLRHKLAVLEDAPSFLAANASIYRYHEDFGYEYIPGARMASAVLREGKVRTCQVGWVNREGNIGIHDRPWKASQYRVLVVGDSFTANPTTMNGPVTWTDFFPEALGSVSGKTAAVKNFARDGFGVPQMLRMAAAQAARLKPDLVLVVFITEDLTRARTWRGTTRSRGAERLVISTEPGQPPDMELAADMYVLYPELPTNLCGVAKPEQDRVEAELMARFERIRRDNLAADLLSLSTSYLYNRLRYQDPFHDAYKPSRNPQIEYFDYEEDPAVLRDVERLKGLGIPVLLVHIPDRLEIHRRQYEFSRRDRSLVRSLERLMGAETLEPLPLCPPPEHVEGCFFPYDEHPNHLGARFYAQLIARAVREHLVAQGAEDPRFPRWVDRTAP